MRKETQSGSRMLESLLRGVSTRQYRAVLPEMPDTMGVSRSSVSHEVLEASEEELRRLCERRLEEMVLMLYLDGVIFGGHHVLVAVGVDERGGSTFWASRKARVRIRRWRMGFWKTW